MINLLFHHYNPLSQEVHEVLSPYEPHGSFDQVLDSFLFSAVGKAVEGLGTLYGNGILVNDFLPNCMIFFHFSFPFF